MADRGMKTDQAVHAQVPYDDEEVALVGESGLDDVSEDADLVLAAGSGGTSEAQRNGVMVLALLDKIIGVVDNIQQTQNGLEARQEAMEKSVSTIQGELTKLSKNHVDTANTVNKMLDKVRKVSVNIKTVRSNLEKQAGQIKKLENNENELLKRRHFKVLIYQDQVKTSKQKTVQTAEGEAVENLEQIPEEDQEGVKASVNSDEEVEIEEIVEESRTKRLQRTTKQQVENIKKGLLEREDGENQAKDERKPGEDQEENPREPGEDEAENPRQPGEDEAQP
ncbi:polymerase I and transcript release factor [Oryzias melastigma]|uniref:Polymerase I and transcript release factor n=1 Tax=Oryzias melastigma TaxID=30732 RepID=A0A834KXI7_ORYME|nr:polymerase I and transcript release factor [Oryzias melastigma]